MLIMESISKIRRLILRDGHSIRSVSLETGLSRNTIRKYLRDGSVPQYRRRQGVTRPKLSLYEERLHFLYAHDQSLPRRERRTAHQLYEVLVTEGYQGSYSPVRRFIRDLKADGHSSGPAFIPLEFSCGDALQFDWSEEHVVLGGVKQAVRVAHFRLCYSRKSFVCAYPSEAQEMVLDAFMRALVFYGGVPRRVIIDNPKTMVTYVSRSKDRIFHPRFLALMNHYVIEPVACTPASGWEKGRVERQVQTVRQQFFVPMLRFDDMAALNVWLEGRCRCGGKRAHPDRQEQTVDEVFEEEKGQLRPLGRGFDGYVEKTVRVRSTCLVQYDSNRYSVPSCHAGKPVSLRAYADRIMVVAGQQVVAEHPRRFTRNQSYFEPWHYVPLLTRKPGALRDGAPFVQWQLPQAMDTIKSHYLQERGGDREFVDLLMLVQAHGMDAVSMACEMAVEQGTLRLPAIINLINQLLEPAIPRTADGERYPALRQLPLADCKRYETLYKQ